MARQARHSVPGSIYHVMLRGNNGQPIFSSDQERFRLCFLIQEGVEEFRHKVLAFCFMTNHIHLVIQPGDVPLSEIFHNLAFRYAQFYNRRHQTVGHLFQGRFKSILVSGTNYIKRLIRYVHLNPVRAGIVEKPEDYYWSSHKAYTMQTKYSWVSHAQGLQYFGDSLNESLEKYQFLLSDFSQMDEVDFKKGITRGVIADDLIIKNWKNNSFNNVSPASKKIVMPFQRYIEEIAKWYQVDIESIKEFGKKRSSSKIRAVAALLARDAENVTLKNLADYFQRSGSSLSEAASYLKSQLHNSDLLKSEIQALKDNLIALS